MCLLVCQILRADHDLCSAFCLQEPEKQNCLALLAFASLLWCTEAIPLFVTSMLVPFLIVLLRVLDDVDQEPPARLTPKQAAPRVFHTMFSQVWKCSACGVPSSKQALHVVYRTHC
jgi:di/tricarboxylate transporter